MEQADAVSDEGDVVEAGEEGGKGGSAEGGGADNEEEDEDEDTSSQLQGEHLRWVKAVRGLPALRQPCTSKLLGM